MNLKSALRWLGRHAMHLAFVAMVVYFTIATGGRFAEPANLINVLNQNFHYVILGVGMTVVIITGGIDLSVGSLVAMCGVVATSVMNLGGLVLSEGESVARFLPVGTSLGVGMGAGVLLALISGTGVGAATGVAVTRFQVPPFIATLAWFLVARGLAYKFCAARPIGNLPESFTWLGQGHVGSPYLRFPVLLAFVLALVMHLLLTRTVFGRRIFAVGGNEEAARLSGIDVARHKLAVYALNGLCAGLCGILLAARLQAGDPKVGSQPPLELGAITAVVLGGASLTGGKGSILGTVFGAMFMGILDNGLALRGMQYFDQLVVKGVVLLAAVLVDQIRNR